MKDRRGHTTTFVYQTNLDKLDLVKSPPVEFMRSNGTLATDTLRTTYKSWHEVIAPSGATSSTPFGVVDTAGVWAEIRDADSNLTRFPDRWGQPLVLRDPLSVDTKVKYNTSGLPVRIDHPAGGYDTLNYNTRGLVTYARSAGVPNAITLNYGSTWTTPTSIVQSGEPTRTFWLGTNGRVDSLNVGNGKVRFTYDGYGRLASVKDGNQVTQVTSAFSGTNGNKSSDTFPAGRKRVYSHDTYGRITGDSTVGLPKRVIAYDILNRDSVVRVDLGSGGGGSIVTKYEYDGLYLIKVTDPKNQVYQYAFNAVGWLTSKTDPLARADVYKYNRVGSLRRWTNRRNQNTDYGYDALQRLTSKTAGGVSDSWSYSTNRREITAIAPQAVVTSYLDSLAAVPDSVKTTFPGLSSKTYWERYRFTGSGRIDSLWTTGSSTLLTARKWIWGSANGNLQDMRLSGGNTTTVYWDPNRRKPLRVSVPSVTDSLKWTTSGALAALASNQASLHRLRRRSERDIAGRLRSEFWDAGPAELGNFFGYDGLSRLKADSAAIVAWDLCTWDEDDGYICPPSALTVESVESYVWDSVGNLRSRTGPGGTATGTYGTGNRIQSFAGCTYATDNDGNVTSRTGTCGSALTLWWSPENRLDSLTLAGVKKRFSYDAHGRLARLDDNGTMRYFVWDGVNLLAELDAAGARRAEYSYYPELDDLHAFIQNSGTPYFAHRDHLDNEILLTNSSGQEKRTYDYGRWGQLTWGWDGVGFSDADRARWKGALWFPEVGLYYMRNRWYETESGRFVSEDQIGIAGGINSYVFAGANPVMGRDPMGLRPCKEGEIVGHTDVETIVTGGTGDIHVVGIVTWHDCGGDGGFGGDFGQPNWPGSPGGSTGPGNRTAWETVGDFAAGFGNLITFGGTDWVREHIPIGCTVGCVDTESPVYTAGQITGGVTSVTGGVLVVARVGFGVTSKIAIHGAHHSFGPLGRLSHIQVNIWRIGAKGSGWVLARIPLPWR